MGNNFAFIDSQNINLGISALGWKLDWRRFRVHLDEHYAVTRAYIFIGYVPENQGLYRSLQSYGYILVFKPVMYRKDGKPKGNVDAELVLQAMIDYPEYERAVIVTSDGDFACLVQYLYEQRKLERVLSPYRKGCSVLLKRAAREKIDFLEDARKKLEYKN
ncbi:MAG: NYN domain-containing protein [Deltaproteobacteria bacterium]|nr:NYN domain-containing protein [Deltaproteobacteria bacterium]